MNLVVISGRGRGAPEIEFPHRSRPQAVASGPHGADGPSLGPRAGARARFAGALLLTEAPEGRWAGSERQRGKLRNFALFRL